MKLIMSLSRRTFLKFALLLPLAGLMFTGCANKDFSKVMAPPSEDDPAGLSGARLHYGDTITISFDGVPDAPLPQEKTVNDDGNISLSNIGTVKAAGKTTGELEQIIHDLYVPSVYLHMNVTVKAGDRVYYVRGEVKTPGRQIYVGQITVTKAITSAGDFGDFANRKNVLLIRANGQRFILNCNRILDGKDPDPGVYPGDQIEVRRRRF